MRASGGHVLYRIRRTHRDGPPAKRYRGTWELSDDSAKQVLATCDLMGAATFGTHDIVDRDRQVWRLAANRAIMPSHWLLTDPARRLVLQFDQQILRKLVNPLRRSGLVLRDEDGTELFRLLDPRTGLLDRVFGAGVGDWMLMAKDMPVAKLVRLPKEAPEPTGLLGRVSKLLASSDQGIASAGPAHVLAAPAALALMMLVSELTDPSGL